MHAAAKKKRSHYMYQRRSATSARTHANANDRQSKTIVADKDRVRNTCAGGEHIATVLQ